MGSYTRQGVRNLNDPNWKYQLRPKRPITLRPEWDDPREIRDTIHCPLSDKDRAEILACCPKASFKTSSRRLSQKVDTHVKMSEVSLRKWYTTLVQLGLGTYSYVFQVSVLTNPDLILQVLDATRP